MKQQTVLITGASRGIGRATALAAAQQGYAVAVNYRQGRAEALQVVEQIEQLGGRAVEIQADVSREDQVVQLFARLDAALPPLYGVVNNAGIVAPQIRLEQVTAERLQRLFEVNVFGTVLCCREAVKRMSTRHGGAGGAIVNVSSVAARLGSAGEYVDYAACKGAVDSLTLGLAREVAGEGIRVNAVRPGMVYTEIHASGGEPGRVDRLAPTIPLGRGGVAEEIAAPILWLLSPEAAYVTGAILDAAGGK